MNHYHRCRVCRHRANLFSTMLDHNLCDTHYTHLVATHQGAPKKIHVEQDRHAYQILRLVQLHPEMADFLDSDTDHTEPPEAQVAISLAPASPAPDPFFSTYLRRS